MTKLSDTPLVILSAAAQREDRNLLPGADEAPSIEPPKDAPAETGLAPKARAPRTGTKQAKLIEMLRAEGGATIEEIVAETGWQAHYADSRIMPM